MSCYSCGEDSFIEVDGARTVCTQCGTVSAARETWSYRANRARYLCAMHPTIRQLTYFFCSLASVKRRSSKRAQLCRRSRLARRVVELPWCRVATLELIRVSSDGFEPAASAKAQRADRLHGAIHSSSQDCIWIQDWRQARVARTDDAEW